MTNCGISRWDDPKEINARLKTLTSQEIWEVDDEYYNNYCKDIVNYVEEFEKKFIRGGQFDQALISGLIRDGHKDNDFVTKLKDLIETINNTAKQFIQTEATNFFDLYVKIGEVLADSKKPTPDTISNLKMLLTSSRNHDSASALEQQHGQWKLFLEIMKNYAIIGSLENKE